MMSWVVLALCGAAWQTSGPEMAAPDEEVVVVTADDQEFEGNFLSFDRQSIVVEIGGETRSFPTETVVTVRRRGVQPSPERHPPELELLDGSLLTASRVTSTGDELTLEGGPAVRLIAPTRLVRAIRFARLDDEKTGNQWREILDANDFTGDLLIFQRDERLDWLEGIVGTITDDEVEFTSNGQTRTAPRARIEGVAWYHAAGREFGESPGHLMTRGGDRIAVNSAIVVANEIALQTPCGLEITLPFDELASIRLGNQLVTWLSELEPVTTEWAPLLLNRELIAYQQVLHAPRFDEGPNGEPLRLERRSAGEGWAARQIEYSRGVAAWGGTRMVWSLDGRYGRLTGIAGLPPGVAKGGTVAIVVSGDGRELVREVLESGRPDPIPLDLELGGVRRLTVEIAYHDGRDIGDLVYLCDMKLFRQEED